MKFTVELEDFWMDEDAVGIEDELKKHITTSVVVQIKRSIQEKVDKEIVKKVGEFVDARLSVIINDKLEELMDSQMIKPIRHSEPVLIADYVKRKFHNDSGWGTPDKHITKIAKQFGEELKLQYNAMFANKIVQGMKEQGLLKDEVVQILLEGK